MILQRLESGEWGKEVRQLPSGVFVPAEFQKKPKGFDLFCGVGGFSMGFMDAGFEVVGAADNDPHASYNYLWNLGAYPLDIQYVEPGDKERLNAVVESRHKRELKEIKAGKRQFLTMTASGSSGYLANRPDQVGVSHFFFGDISKLTGERILKALGLKRGELDCVFGGPPCQGYSTANKNRNPDDPRNNLTLEFVRLVLELQPQAIAMENVPEILNMTTPEGLPMIDVICKSLAEGGFSTYEALRQSLAGKKGRRAAYNVGEKQKSKKQASTKSPPRTQGSSVNDAQGSLFGKAS